MALAFLVFALILVIALPDLQAMKSDPFFFVLQMKRLLVFGGAVSLAFLVRGTNSDAHKRLMFLGTYAVLDAAFFRMDWLLPNLGTERWVVSAHIWQYCLFLPFLAHDIRTLGRVHAVFLFGIPLIVAFQGAAAFIG